MDNKEKATIYESLQICESYVQANIKSIGEAYEAEERSKHNELLAVELLKFGTFVADTAHMAQVEKDHVEQYYEFRKLQIMDETGMPANKAESNVKTEIEYVAKLDKLRDIQKSAEVLKRKQRSLESILDQSRSRLSLVSKGLPS